MGDTVESTLASNGLGVGVKVGCGVGSGAGVETEYPVHAAENNNPAILTYARLFTAFSVNFGPSPDPLNAGVPGGSPAPQPPA